MQPDGQMVEPVRKFVVENFLFGRSDGVGDSDSFLESGIIDSTGILQLVTFLEQTYGIQVLDEELIPDNLDSFQNILQYLQKKQAVLPGLEKHKAL